MTKVRLLAILLAAGCAERKPIPGVVQPNPGEALTSIPGPMPNFGPFATVDEALLAACPIFLSQPHAVIPVRPGDQNFRLYWGMAEEYCAWFYSPDGKQIEMSFLTVSAIQDDPAKRQCALPPNVKDDRYPADGIIYLVLGHSHPAELELSTLDLRLFAEMAQVHGLDVFLNGREVSMSVVAFFGEEHDGRVTCSGFYQYLPRPKSELVKVTVDKRTGRWRRKPIGRIRWDENREPFIAR